MTTSSNESSSSGTPQKRPRWWYSSDDRRGFAWASVVGYSYHEKGTKGFESSVLYIYLQGAILHLSGIEADEVYKELTKR